MLPLKYRDALIDKWANDVQNKTEYKNKAKENFPFIKLLMIINRDILFIALQILKDILLVKDLKNEKKKQLI